MGFDLAGCKKFVQIPSPITELSSTSVFANQTTATTAQIGIYAQMSNYGESFYMALNTGLLSDELTNYNNSSGGIGQIECYQNAMDPITFSGGGIGNSGAGCWASAYNYIWEANSVLEGVKGNSALSTITVNQLIGEAEFTRAFWFFYLVNCYGAVPLTTTTNYKTNESLPRASANSVYQQIISDLQDASTKLNNNFVDATDTTVTSDRGRPTSWAAKALLARVYLYTNDFSNAYTASNDVLTNNGGLFSLLPDGSLGSVFLANSTEAIWQLDIVEPNSQNTLDGQDFILTSAPGNNIQGSSLSPQLLAAFEPGDQRYVNWVDSIIAGQTYYFPIKYKINANNNTNPATENYMMLRLAEQYLIRAEAQAHGAGGGASGAITDLNTIRQRANLNPYDSTINGSLLKAILHERQVELFTEWGHRWFDLVRTGAVDTVLGSPGNVCQYKGGVWNPPGYPAGYQKLFPISQSQINANPFLTQNPGYN